MSVKYNNIEKIIAKLMEKGYTISFMESCTGGGLANAFTNIKGCSNVLKMSAITYNSEAKIKFGVNPKTIEKYTVYSSQVSKEMAKSICKYSNSQLGIGITGNLNFYNCSSVTDGNKIYISIYNAPKKHFTTKIITIKSCDRANSKEAIINFICQDLLNILEIN